MSTLTTFLLLDTVLNHFIRAHICIKCFKDTGFQNDASSSAFEQGICWPKGSLARRPGDQFRLFQKKSILNSLFRQNSSFILLHSIQNSLYLIWNRIFDDLLCHWSLSSNLRDAKVSSSNNFGSLHPILNYGLYYRL